MQQACVPVQVPVTVLGNSPRLVRWASSRCGATVQDTNGSPAHATPVCVDPRNNNNNNHTRTRPTTPTPHSSRMQAHTHTSTHAHAPNNPHPPQQPHAGTYPHIHTRACAQQPPPPTAAACRHIPTHPHTRMRPTTPTPPQQPHAGTYPHIHTRACARHCFTAFVSRQAYWWMNGLPPASCAGPAAYRAWSTLPAVQNALHVKSHDASGAMKYTRAPAGDLRPLYKRIAQKHRLL